MSTAKHRGSTGSNCVTREAANVSENVKIYWIAEYNDLTWECNQLGSFPPSSLETECENLSFFWLPGERAQQKCESFQSSSYVKMKVSIFLCSRTFTQNRIETNEIHKQKMEKQEVKNPATVLDCWSLEAN